jgi:hypothetical protein
VKGRILSARLVDRTPADIAALIRKCGLVRAAAAFLNLPKSTVHDLVKRRVRRGWRKHMEIAR